MGNWLKSFGTVVGVIVGIACITLGMIYFTHFYLVETTCVVGAFTFFVVVYVVKQEFYD
jgi:hypothetical protein